ncbi:DUF4411 family protein [Arthrobacter sulfonylureivorans]|uniref:DUF4411 family protein n=1 Tax=Arthrobacter sulfonylureivorans TaxID=2486855 RepID=UPI0039E22CEE
MGVRPWRERCRAPNWARRHENRSRASRDPRQGHSKSLDWVQDQKNDGDPFVIAHAKHSLRVIVTEETRKGPGTIDKNQKIPNIADEHGAEWVKFFEFVRAQGLKF